MVSIVYMAFVFMAFSHCQSDINPQFRADGAYPSVCSLHERYLAKYISYMNFRSCSSARLPTRSMRQRISGPLCSFVACTMLISSSYGALDGNGNGLDTDHDGMDDVWEMIYGAQSLVASIDTDGDGFTNSLESRAGTDPFDPASRPVLQITPFSNDELQLGYARVAGKRYKLFSSVSLDQPTWSVDVTEVAQDSDGTAYALPKPVGAKYWRLEIDNVDSDGDGLSDAEERWVGFNPASTHTDRVDALDTSRLPAELNAASIVTIGVLDAKMSERWIDPGMFVVRRTGGVKPITVNVAFAGTAIPGSDYTKSIAGTTVYMGPGVREQPIFLSPIADTEDAEGDETIILTAQSGVGYTVGAASSGTIILENETATSPPKAKAAARFLIQAAFGPDQDASGDADDIPENVEEVMSMGFDAWITDQFTRPVGLIQPWVDWILVPGRVNQLQLYGNAKEFSWWNRAMGVPKLRPDAANTVLPDPLRQRLAFALSEILVASDRPEAFANTPLALPNFYDLFETHAFGNYHDLLQAVALHPVMGVYLSHLGNQKANVAAKIYPDENFAREIMQLFSIGLWMLNPDGTRALTAQGQPVPTYTNSDITELARVFTGLTYADNSAFGAYSIDYTEPMKGWDSYHDCNAKVLLGNLQLPSRIPSSGTTGAATMADVSAAITNLFNHQNVGPFIGYRLIQRFVTSNPSPAYIGRVSAAFADDGNGVRGDMKAVIRAVLMDPEARDSSMMSVPTWGKMREPLLRCVNFARAFNAFTVAGSYSLDQFSLHHLQDPMNSPSVFNFFLPAYSPSGELAQIGIAAPEFQLINASSSISGPNYFWDHILGDISVQGTTNPDYGPHLNLNPELAYVVNAADIGLTNPPAASALDPDPLLRRLDLVLTGGTLSPQQFQIIREAILRIPPTASTNQWHRERLRLAIYLIVTSPDFNVLR